jgi:hypothetical protein
MNRQLKKNTYPVNSVPFVLVFLKISMIADNMGGRRTRGQLSCRNIPLSRKAHAIVLLFYEEEENYS